MILLSAFLYSRKAALRNGQEHPQAHIVPKDGQVTAESIATFMDNRLSAYKKLTGGIVFTSIIPKSTSGKILRRMLKDPASTTSARL
jgi:acyl-coenzyme A synthetase/AMP-(fatty) acid ligase